MFGQRPLIKTQSASFISLNFLESQGRSANLMTAEYEGMWYNG